MLLVRMIHSLELNKLLVDREIELFPGNPEIVDNVNHHPDDFFFHHVLLTKSFSLNEHL